MCLHLPRPLPVGETLRLAFALPDGGGTVEALARVTWCAPLPGGARLRFCETGLRFEALGERDRGRIAAFVRQRQPSGLQPEPSELQGERLPADG